MFLINIFDYIFELEPLIYIIGSFAFFGVNLLVRKIMLHKGV